MENKYKININGVCYDILSDKNSDFVSKLESYVNNKITTIMDENPKVSVATAAIYAALNAGEDLIYERESADAIRSQVTEYSKEIYEKENLANMYKEKYENALREIERLKHGI